jgi:hypothetical protein
VSWYSTGTTAAGHSLYARRLHSFRFTDSIDERLPATAAWNPSLPLIPTWFPCRRLWYCPIQLPPTKVPTTRGHMRKRTTMEHLKALLLTSSAGQTGTHLPTDRSCRLHATLSAVARSIKSNLWTPWAERPTRGLLLPALSHVLHLHQSGDAPWLWRPIPPFCHHHNCLRSRVWHSQVEVTPIKPSKMCFMVSLNLPLKFVPSHLFHQLGILVSTAF